MTKQNKSALTFGFCLLCCVKLLPAVAQEESFDAQNRRLNISPMIQGQERANMATLLASLPSKARENVILYAQDGNVYVNKPKLRAQASLLVQVQDNVYQDKTGSLFSYPAHTPKPVEDKSTLIEDLTPAEDRAPRVWIPNTFKGSGPYRQVYSKVPPNDSTPGFSYEDAHIYLPTHRGKTIGPDPMRGKGHYKYGPGEIYENPKTQDTAYVYMGGWSATATFIPTTPTSGNPVRTTSIATDAGYQYDKSRHGNYKESWVMSVNPEAAIYGSGVNQAYEYAGAFRLVAGQSPFFTSFFVSSSSDSNGRLHTFLVLEATSAYAIDYSTGNYIGLGTWTLAKEVTTAGFINNISLGKVVDAAKNLFCPWNVNGNGMVLKRMTSIAQQDTKSDGSGNMLVDIPNTCSYIKSVQWSNCHLGIVGPNAAAGQIASLQSWNAANYGGAIDYYIYYPQIPSVVLHTPGSGYDETDSVTIP